MARPSAGFSASGECPGPREALITGSRFEVWALALAIRLMRCVPIIALILLAACASGPHRSASRSYAPSRYYAPPGPASDPWGPYIREAAGRFEVPEQWVRAVMRQESGGQAAGGLPCRCHGADAADAGDL